MRHKHWKNKKNKTVHWFRRSPRLNLLPISSLPNVDRVVTQENDGACRNKGTSGKGWGLCRQKWDRSSSFSIYGLILAELWIYGGTVLRKPRYFAGAIWSRCTWLRQASLTLENFLLIRKRSCMIASDQFMVASKMFLTYLLQI